ncbi:MAG: hypothetical protein ACXIUM_02785 [Wenzhouxiangella sp.]
MTRSLLAASVVSGSDVAINLMACLHLHASDLSGMHDKKPPIGVIK